MNQQSIIKFVSLLKKDLKKIQNNVSLFQTICKDQQDIVEKDMIEKIQKDWIIIDNLIRIFETKPEMWSELTEIFKDFDVLSSYLSRYHLKDKECVDIIFYIISKNLCTNLLEQRTLLVDARQLSNYPFQTMTSEEAEQIVFNGGIYRLLTKEDEELSSKMRAQKEGLWEFARKHCIDISEFVEQHRFIKLHYLDKNTFFNQEDIEEVMEALKNLGVSPSVCSQIKSALYKDYEKIEMKMSIQKNFKVQETGSSQKLLTDKEYKAIRKELEMYYDFYHNQIIRDLSYEEIIYCISLLLKLGEDRQKITEFLLKVLDRQECRGKTWADAFGEKLNWLRFYQETMAPHLEERVTDLEQCFFEFYNTDKEDELLIWQSLLLEEFKNIQDQLPKNCDCNFEYEIHLAKKLSRRKEESK